MKGHRRGIAESLQNPTVVLNPLVTKGTLSSSKHNFQLEFVLRYQCLTFLIYSDKMNLLVWSLISCEIKSLYRDASAGNKSNPFHFSL